MKCYGNLVAIDAVLRVTVLRRSRRLRPACPYPASSRMKSGSLDDRQPLA